MTTLAYARSTAAAVAVASIAAMATALSPAHADDWRQSYDEITLVRTVSSTEVDRRENWEPIADFLSERLGIDVELSLVSEHAVAIEALDGGHAHLARIGPSAYAVGHRVTGGKLDPLVSELDADGNDGYYSIVIVPQDSPVQTLDDLEGAEFAFTAASSASGFVAPNFFLRDAGYDPDTYFANTVLAGNHSNAVLGVARGNYDAAATWWAGEDHGPISTMIEDGMIEPGSVRVIWESPLLPFGPYVAHTDLPEDMREAIREALLALPVDAPDLFEASTGGGASGLVATSHEVYEGIIAMTEAAEQQRR